MLSIEKVSKEHLSSIARIEALCFSEPWSEESLELLLGENATALVALMEDRVVGYVGLTYVLDEGQITNLAVHPDARRRGVGIALMRALELLAKEKNLIFLSLEVRESNLAARSLYSSLGWEDRGVRKNFYSHPMENAVVMTRDLPQISR